jgi:hypothetical protein
MKRSVATAVFAALVAVSLLAGLTGGLARLGVVAPALLEAKWLARAALSHAAMMMGAFLGTVIAIERAVAVKRPEAFIAPLASALAGLCLLLQQGELGAWMLVVASAVFVGVNIIVVRRQWASHTLLLLASSFCWFAGNVLFAFGFEATAVLPWWFAFLVMTIAAERLEMTRLMRQHAAAPWLLLTVLAALVAGAAISAFSAATGGMIYGASLTLLALWLMTFDIARRTVFAQGLSRYMAICLLCGYAWLAYAGIAWLGTALGCPGRDSALHALGLGFIFSMIMGHAPVILPAVARVKLEFGNFFYVPLAMLHVSLIVRLGLGSIDISQRMLGASLNAAAIALFAATMAGAAVAWRIRHGTIRAKATT